MPYEMFTKLNESSDKEKLLTNTNFVTCIATTALTNTSYTVY